MSELLLENDTERAMYLTKRMHREIKRYKHTEPFHSARKCDDHRCVWHEKRKR